MGEEMTEIKFRAWDKKKKKMFYLDGIIHLHLGLIAWTFSSPDEVYVCGGKRDNGILMQYTGLKDKNGKEIYEGDIVKYREYSSNEKSELCKIEWFEGYEGDGFKMTGFVSPAYDYPTDVEIIGNIYENPELMKEKK